MKYANWNIIIFIIFIIIFIIYFDIINNDKCIRCIIYLLNLYIELII